MLFTFGWLRCFAMGYRWSWLFIVAIRFSGWLALCFGFVLFRCSFLGLHSVGLYLFGFFCGLWLKCVCLFVDLPWVCIGFWV